MTDTQPEALRLADELDAVPETGADPQTIQEAAAELRRLHAYCQELESHLILDGTPAVAGKPVAWLSPWRADQVTTDYDAYGEHGIPLYTAPKPVEREPLTDEWIRSRCKEPWVFETAKQWVRMAEAAHGINKGGQHGTE